MYSVILVVSMAGAPEVPQFGLKSKFGCNTCQPAPVVVTKSCDTPKCGCGLFGKLKGCFSCQKPACPTNDCATPACGTPGAPACGTTVIPPTTGTPAPPAAAPAPAPGAQPMPAPKAEPKPAKVG